MLSSAYSYKSADAFALTGKSLNSVADNYSDAVLLGVVWNMNDDDPLIASLDTKYYDGNDGKEDFGENYGLYLSVMGAAKPNTDYSRYWHGSAAVIRPLMLVTDVNGIKNIGLCTALLLLAANAVLLAYKKQYFCAAALVISFVSVQIWNIRLSMEYQFAVLVCLAILPFFILHEKKHGDILPVLSVISGAAAAFFDFLTCETLTILIPLAVVFSMREKENRNFTLRENLRITADCGVSWGISYVLMFLLKWTAASLVTGENKFAAAFSSASERIYGEANGLSASKLFFLSPIANISTLFGGTERISWVNTVIGLLLSALIAGAALHFFGKKRQSRGFAVLILILGACVYLRYAVLGNHSYLHEFFTYRAQAAVIFAVLSAIWHSIGIGKTKRGGKNRK